MASGVKSFLDDGPPPRGQGQPPRKRDEMECPNCGLRQALALDCVGCGAIIDRVGEVAPEPPPGAVEPGGLAAAPPVADPVPGAVETGALLAAPPVVEPPPSDEEALAGGAGDLYQGTNPFADDGAHKLGADGRSRPYPTDELSALSIFGEALGVLSRHFVSFMIIAGVVLLPAILLTGYTTNELNAMTDVELASPEFKRALTLLGLNGLIRFLCMPLATAAVTFGVGQELRRRKTTMFDCVQAALGSLVPVVGVTLLQTLLIGLVACLLVIAGVAGFIVVLGPLVAISPGAARWPFIGGTVLILVLIARFAAAFAVTVPATLEERPGVFGALRRSWQLTRGCRWAIVMFYVALTIAGSFLGLALGFFEGLVLGGTGELAGEIAFIVITAVNAAGAAVIYYRLRSDEEGVSIEHLPAPTPR